MFPVVAFGLGLALATGLCLKSGNEGLKRSALVMVANWAGVLVACAVTGSVTPWSVFVALDLLSAMIVLRHPASRPQAIIGTLYLFQITFHSAYALVGSAAASLLYLDLLALGGWLQLCTLTWGAINGGGMRYSDHTVSRRLPVADSPHNRSMGEDR